MLRELVKFWLHSLDAKFGWQAALEKTQTKNNLPFSKLHLFSNYVT